MNEKLKVVLSVVVLALVGGGVGYWLSAGKPPGTATPPVGEVQTPPPAGNTEGIPVTVTYSDNGFEPNTVRVKKGELVVWVNKSSDTMWVGADPHPTHTEYPTKGGCISTEFDQCTRGKPNTLWAFTFGEAGTWTYHNHSNPTHRGTVVAE